MIFNYYYTSPVTPNNFYLYSFTDFVNFMSNWGIPNAFSIYGSNKSSSSSDKFNYNSNTTLLFNETDYSSNYSNTNIYSIDITSFNISFSSNNNSKCIICNSS